MEEFKGKYKEEATDLINDLEKALLSLEDNPKDKSLIEKIFRVMHSLKGGGAMFGFEKISEFTHHLESIYDLVRSGKVEVTTDLLNITLQSVDHLKVLLNDEVYSEKVITDNEELTRKIKQIVQQKDSVFEEKITKKININTNEKQYHIYFEPYEDIFDNGTNPLYLLDELHLLGTCQSTPIVKQIPDFKSINVLKCYVSWDIILTTKEDINTIKDIFIFVEDDCEIQIKTEEEVKVQTKLEVIKSNSIIQKNTEEKKQNTVKQDVIKEVYLKTASKESVISSVRVSSERLDHLMNLVSELVTTQASLSLFAESNQLSNLLAISENVENISRQLRDLAFSISLVTLETLLTRFQRLVRDLSTELGKSVLFKTEGLDTEIDKNLIEVLNEPLMHILRNSIDHGIEIPEKRIAAGKKPQGEILLKAFYSGTNVHIQVKDDGQGIDIQNIKEKAIKNGFISEDANLSEKEILNLIFISGLSTAHHITGISGRGVGMDIVKRKINEIRGEIELDTKLGKGTTITIKLPLTLSIIDGLLVKIDATHFIIPLSVVDKIYAVEHKQLINSYNSMINLDGVLFPFHHLSQEFGLDRNIPETEELVVVKYENQRVALAVDSVIGEYQAVLKPLGKMFRHQEMISGASILGDGTVALVMDTNKIIKILSKEI